ncbi:MAG: putative 4-mercaptohistidine N1-methyltransferase [Verrucomicrobiota bacterium]
MGHAFYETDRAVSEYLLFHYGPLQGMMPYAFGPREALEFPVRCVTEGVAWPQLSRAERALDLGCAVGRSTFELARRFQEVIGADASEQFIRVATRLRDSGAIAFSFIEEGELRTRATATVPPAIDRSRVRFEVANAEALPPDWSDFDLVLMANLLDRLHEPRRCLEALPARIRRGGQLIVTSPYTWSSEFTPRENWLGGWEAGGQAVRTFETLEKILGPHFELCRRSDMPFLIREHARKYQWSVAELTVWIRK